VLGYKEGNPDKPYNDKVKFCFHSGLFNLLNG